MSDGPALPADAPRQPVAGGAVPSDYQVGPGDVLEISVWKEEGLTKDALVRPDGGLTFPLVGEIHAGGKTVDQINQEIVKGLSGYLSEPAVSVAVKLANQKFYVVGKVNKPGEFPSPARIDVMQAISMAGGLTPFADDDDIRILRREGGRVVSYTFDYGSVSGGDDLDQNIVLRGGDVVVVP
ncbi:polysaccharide biosynthesis/export family protein [Methylococcus sp. EFPC2]|uniref:polysaccharide biosynthesis/export family protein n=1 Tax=Methylococcus sp. EFPC2 TaxID=2812648 RepID=UPI0019688C45|nr:polysaccharide biosynthesis/export family protein [Methylococcus sp. EFPC2]QSA97590.1 polysaccharide biosynthesis/export family protein [Methylococcus sp. EFPC2]